jgi:hypothetical protein
VTTPVDLTATTDTEALRERFQMAADAAQRAGEAFERDLWRAADTYARRTAKLEASLREIEQAANDRKDPGQIGLLARRALTAAEEA